MKRFVACVGWKTRLIRPCKQSNKVAAGCIEGQGHRGQYLSRYMMNQVKSSTGFTTCAGIVQPTSGLAVQSYLQKIVGVAVYVASFYAEDAGLFRSPEGSAHVSADEKHFSRELELIVTPLSLIATIALTVCRRIIVADHVQTANRHRGERRGAEQSLQRYATLYIRNDGALRNHVHQPPIFRRLRSRNSDIVLCSASTTPA